MQSCNGKLTGATECADPSRLHKYVAERLLSCDFVVLMQAKG